jgi:exosortase
VSITNGVAEVVKDASPSRRADGAARDLARPGPGFSITWVHLLVLAAAFGALFWINLQRLWQWTNPSSGDPNWGHSIFIPLISLAYLLERRDQLKQTPILPTAAGLMVMLCGIALFVSGIGLGTNFVQFGPYLQDVGMIATLLGCVLAVFGWSMVRLAAFPIAYLLCALPWPPYVHEVLTAPLQNVAATASVWGLQLTGMNVEQAGNTIHILSASGVDRALNVAEACAGMRSLITFIAIGLAVAFLSARPMWQKIIISLSAVPIAVLCNVFRIFGQGLLDQYVSQSLSEGFAHAAVGVVLLVPGFGLFLLVGWLLDRLTIGKKTGGQRGTARVNRPASIPSPASVPGPTGGSRARRMYVAVVCILLTAAGALATTSRTLHFYFLKVPVPLSKPLTQLSPDLGPWHLCGGNETISEDLEQKLGTSEYVFRQYIDRRVVGDQAIDALRQNPAEAATIAQAATEAHPGAVVRLAVTYYTGRVDAVIHQSERCNVAGGIATSIESIPQTWDLGGRKLNVKLLHLINDSVDAHGPHYVAYCYFVNGHEETEAWRVRNSLMNIFERYAWYAKVEVTSSLADPVELRRVLSDFLRYALPEIERSLPPMRAPAGNPTSARAATAVGEK